MPSLTIKARPLDRRPTGQEDEVFDLSPSSQEVIITFEDGRQVQVLTDCGTLLIRPVGDGATFTVMNTSSSHVRIRP